MEEKFVSFLDNEKPLTQADITKLEEVLGYEIQVSNDFFQLPDEDRDFGGLLKDVLFEQNQAVWLDWKWNAEELFTQLVGVFPELGIELESSSVENADDMYEAIVRIKYKIKDETKEDSMKWAEGPGKWIGELNRTLLDRTGLQLVFYETGGDERCWFKAKADFSEDDFNAAVSLDASVN